MKFSKKKLTEISPKKEFTPSKDTKEKKNIKTV